MLHLYGWNLLIDKSITKLEFGNEVNQGDCQVFFLFREKERNY